MRRSGDNPVTLAWVAAEGRLEHAATYRSSSTARGAATTLCDVSSSQIVESDAPAGEPAEPSASTLTELYEHAWLDRDLSWLEFNRRVLARGARRAEPAARARQVPGDLLFEPGRVLHEADSADSTLVRRHKPCRTGPSGPARAQPRDNRLDVGRASGLLQRGDQAGAGRARNPSRRLGRSHRCPVRGSIDGVRQGDLAGVDAAQPRCGSSFPVCLEPVDFVGVPSRGSGQRGVGSVRVKVPRELPQWLRVRAGVEPPVPCLRRSRSGDRCQRRAALPRDGGRQRQPVQSQP